jgi:hypothetical protein
MFAIPPLPRPQSWLVVGKEKKRKENTKHTKKKLKKSHECWLVWYQPFEHKNMSNSASRCNPILIWHL